MRLQVSQSLLHQVYVCHVIPILEWEMIEGSQSLLHQVYVSHALTEILWRYLLFGSRNPFFVRSMFPTLNKWSFGLISSLC